MKPRNQFTRLPEADQKFILSLCDQHGYEKAAELLAEDRPTGLNLNTSRSALQRFYASHHPDPALTLRAAEYARALQIRHQAADGPFLEGLFTLVEVRLLESLRNGANLADLAPDFRILNGLHKTFLAHEEWRRENPVGAQKAYRKYIDHQALVPDCDFMRNDIENDPGAEGVHECEFAADFTDEEHDISVTRGIISRAEAARAAAIAAQQQALASSQEKHLAPEPGRASLPASHAPASAPLQSVSPSESLRRCSSQVQASAPKPASAPSFPPKNTQICAQIPSPRGQALPLNPTSHIPRDHAKNSPRGNCPKDRSLP